MTERPRRGVRAPGLQLYEFNDALVVSAPELLVEHFSDFVVYAMDGENLVIVAKPTGKLPRPSFYCAVDRALSTRPLPSASALRRTSRSAIRRPGERSTPC